MATNVDYKSIIEDIKKTKDNLYILDQKKAKKICNAELPKSLFNNNYIKQRKNDLSKFLIDGNFEYEVIPAQIRIKLRK